MISYKRDVLERQRSKDGQKLSNLWKTALKECGILQNNVPQCQIAKALRILSSTVHHIIKRFRETGEISVRKRQGRIPFLDAHGPWDLRRHCITHRNDYVIDITKWAQEYFQKPLSVNTIRLFFKLSRVQIWHSCWKSRTPWPLG